MEMPAPKGIILFVVPVGSCPDFFPSFFSFLAVSPYLKIWCMEIVFEGLLFIEIFFQSLGDYEMVHG